jgi:hypothetical protein
LEAKLNQLKRKLRRNFLLVENGKWKVKEIIKLCLIIKYAFVASYKERSELCSQL